MMDLIGRYEDGEVIFDIKLSDEHTVNFLLLYDTLITEVRFSSILNHRDDILFTSNSMGMVRTTLDIKLEPYARYLESLGSLSNNGYGSYQVINYDLLGDHLQNDYREIREFNDNLQFLTREFISENLP